jgi:FixJ family two-component response regulator
MPEMKSILIVDDDASLRETLAILFESMGWKNRTLASSFEEVRSVLPAISHYALAILDVNLGDDRASGVDVFHWLKQHNFPGKIVFFTGHARTHPLVQVACEMPGVEVIEKPAPFERLQKLSEECL